MSSKKVKRIADKNNRVNHIELLTKVYSEVSGYGLSKRDVKRVYDSLIKNIVDSLESGKDVTLPRFAHFIVAERKSFVGRHPITQEEIIYPSRIKCYIIPKKNINNACDILTKKYENE